MLLKRKVVNRWQVLNGRQDSRGLDHFSIPCETPVIPAKAGIQSVHSAFPKVRGVDSRFRGNDCGLERPCLANDTTTRLACALNPDGLTCILCAYWHWFSVKVSVRTVADPSCPRTCLTRPLYEGAVGKATSATNVVSWAIGYQPTEAGERSQVK